MDVTCVSTEVRVLKVLLIENDEEVARDVCFWLRVRYPQAVVVTVGEGRKGLDLVETEMPDLIMSASHLPDMNILKLITEIRGFCTVPIIILCKAQSDSERAIVLEAGADALIREPFAPLELAAWVRVMLRNAGAGGFCERDIVSISSKLSINFATQEVLVSGRPVRITPIEFRLLAHLVRNAGKR